jgi:hypothetical protein
MILLVMIATTLESTHYISLQTMFYMITPLVAVSFLSFLSVITIAILALEVWKFKK